MIKRKSRRLFGTDGIRGRANEYPLVPELVTQLGRTLVHLAKRDGNEPKVLIGRDTRATGPGIEEALCQGICSMGGQAYLGGVMTTPGVAYCGRQLGAIGISVSASHNPSHDNGIKVFWFDGRKLPDSQEAIIESFVIDRDGQPLGPSVFFDKGSSLVETSEVKVIDEVNKEYEDFLVGILDPKLCFNGEKLVIDCANGAATDIAPNVFERLGADLVVFGNKPNGENINDGCGALNPGPLSELVVKEGAVMGVAFDGDADRLVVVDERGEILDGDEILAICGVDMIEQGLLKDNTVVATVMSNIGLLKCLEGVGGRLVRTDVGDRYVEEAMLTNGYKLGGEQSGHIIFSDHHTTGDGILSAIQIYGVQRRKDKPLSELRKIFNHYPQILLNVKVKHKLPFSEVPGLASKIKDVEEKLGSEGRIVVRYSGTESVVRIMLEGKDREVIKSLGKEVKEAFEHYLG